jgi:SpoIIAA-like
MGSIKETNMIVILPQSTEDCLVVRFSGKVDSQDYQQFLEAINPRLKEGNPISLVVELQDFKFYGDFESAKQDFKFGFGEYSLIHRAALVGDQKWIEWFTRFIGPFTRTEEKHFSENQLEEATKWACE